MRRGSAESEQRFYPPAQMPLVERSTHLPLGLRLVQTVTRMITRRQQSDSSPLIAVVRHQVAGEEARGALRVGGGDLEGIEVFVGVGHDLQAGWHPGADCHPGWDVHHRAAV